MGAPVFRRPSSKTSLRQGCEWSDLDRAAPPGGVLTARKVVVDVSMFDEDKTASRDFWSRPPSCCHNHRHQHHHGTIACRLGGKYPPWFVLTKLRHSFHALLRWVTWLRYFRSPGLTEEQLIQILSHVGQVDNFRLVHDPQTGQSKGFGFAGYHDVHSAASAVRNLDGYHGSEATRGAF